MACRASYTGYGQEERDRGGSASERHLSSPTRRLPKDRHLQYHANDVDADMAEEDGEEQYQDDDGGYEQDHIQHASHHLHHEAGNDHHERFAGLWRTRFSKETRVLDLNALKLFFCS